MTVYRSYTRPTLQNLDNVTSWKDLKSKDPLKNQPPLLSKNLQFKSNHQLNLLINNSKLPVSADLLSSIQLCKGEEGVM